MELLGEYLKRIRESKNLSLEAVAAKTKISRNYLNAIEESKFDDLPGEVFTKGFLRSYARFLCIDEEDIINRYSQWKKEFISPDSKIEELISKKDELKRSRDIRNRAAQIIVPLTIILAIIFAFLFLKKEEPIKKVEKEKKGVKTERIAAKDDKGAATQVADKKDVEKPAQQVEQPKKEKNSMALIINANEQSWLMITIDDKEKRDMLLQPGEKISLKAEKNFLLTLGNAGGVDIEFNGKKLEPFGPKGMVVSNILLAKEKIGHKKAAPAIKKPAAPKEEIKEDGAESPPQTTNTNQ